MGKRKKEVERDQWDIDELLDQVKVPRLTKAALKGTKGEERRQASMPGARLAAMAGPVPVDLVREWKAWPELDGFERVGGLAVPMVPTSWSQRCKKNPELAWALWTGLRALGIDRMVLVGGPLPLIDPGSSAGALARIDFRPQGLGRIVLLSMKETETLVDGVEVIKVRLGGKNKEGISPGLSLEDALMAVGEPTEGRALDDMVGYATMDDVVRLEVEFARRWLLADRTLGLTALLGPLSAKLLGGRLWERQKLGYLDERGAMTLGGWWRLAYLAKQGVGQMELARASWLQNLYERRDPRTAVAKQNEQGEMVVDPLTARHGRRRHLRLTQQMALKLMQTEDMIPLGVELSATAKLIGRYQRMKPDALLVKPSGTLVWLEILRRNEDLLAFSPPNDMRKQPGDRYKRMREQAIPWLATVLDRPVELVVKEPAGLKRTIFRPVSKKQMSFLDLMPVEEMPAPIKPPTPEKKKPQEPEWEDDDDMAQAY